MTVFIPCQTVISNMIVIDVVAGEVELRLHMSKCCVLFSLDQSYTRLWARNIRGEPVSSKADSCRHSLIPQYQSDVFKMMLSWREAPKCRKSNSNSFLASGGRLFWGKGLLNSSSWGVKHNRVWWRDKDFILGTCEWAHLCVERDKL